MELLECRYEKMRIKEKGKRRKEWNTIALFVAVKSAKMNTKVLMVCVGRVWMKNLPSKAKICLEMLYEKLTRRKFTSVIGSSSIGYPYKRSFCILAYRKASAFCYYERKRTLLSREITTTRTQVSVKNGHVEKTHKV